MFAGNPVASELKVLFLYSQIGSFNSEETICDPVWSNEILRDLESTQNYLQNGNVIPHKYVAWLAPNIWLHKQKI